MYFKLSVRFQISCQTLLDSDISSQIKVKGELKEEVKQLLY